MPYWAQSEMLHQQPMLVHVMADTGLIENYRNARTRQFATRPDAGELKDARRTNRTSREKDLAVGLITRQLATAHADHGDRTALL